VAEGQQQVNRGARQYGNTGFDESLPVHKYSEKNDTRLRASEKK
jgi:hypothetical protein